MSKDTLSNAAAAWRRQHIDGKAEVCAQLRDLITCQAYGAKERKAFTAALNLLAEAQRSPVAGMTEKRRKARAARWKG